VTGKYCGSLPRVDPEISGRGYSNSNPSDLFTEFPHLKIPELTHYPFTISSIHALKHSRIESPPHSRNYSFTFSLIHLSSPFICKILLFSGKSWRASF
jgi:hypothetical protein